MSTNFWNDLAVEYWEDISSEDTIVDGAPLSFEDADDILKLVDNDPSDTDPWELKP